MTAEPEDRSYPTLRSILQPEALAESVGAAYGLEVTGCSLLKTQLSDLYRVDSEAGPYILRVYPHGLNLSKWVAAEVMILNDLIEKGIPVSAPVPRRDGSWLLPLDAPEGERCAVLFTYAHGRSLKRAGEPGLFVEFGRLAARMHIAAAALPPGAARVSLDGYTLLARPLEVIGLTYPERTGEIEELREAARIAQQVFDVLPQSTWGFCHGDLNFSNVHVDPQGKLTLFQFEYCGPGWPAYDVATVMNFESVDAARFFMEGYERERPLSPLEREALGWFQIANRLWMLGTAAGLSSIFGSGLTSGLLFDQTLEFVRERTDSLVGR